MRAAVFPRTGPPDVLEVRDLPDPGEPGPGEVRVRVGAVSVNPIDTYVRGGTVSPGTPPTADRPRVTGCDWTGTVEAVGEGVTTFAAGDRVWGVSRGIARGGSAAEVISEPAELCFPTPAGTTDADAAGLGLAAVTAHLGLFRTGGLTRGEGRELVFVQGGSGGVGSAAIALANRAGYRVVSTAGTEAKREECRRRGAEGVLDYREPKLARRLEAIRDHEPAGGFAVWLETHREPDLHAALPAMKKGGTVVLLAGRDAVPSFPLGPLYTRDVSLCGFAMFNATPDELRTAADGVAGIAPLIARTYPLTDIARAHADLEAGETGERGGKLVVTLDS